MLLEQRPLWTAELQAGQHGGRLSHARLLPAAVVGCWFALERATGRRLWSAAGLDADEIFGVGDDIVLGTRVSGAGATLETRGLWGVSLATGALLWRWPELGALAFAARAVRRLLGLAEPLSDGPLLLQGGRLYTRGRQVLDCRTGLVLGGPAAAPCESAEEDADEEMSTELFFLRSVELPGTGTRLLRQFDSKDPMEHLRHERCSHPEPVAFNFGAVDVGGRLVWERRYDKARRPVTNFFGSRLLGGRLLVVEHSPDAHLVVLDPVTGEQEQAIALPSASACIQSVDAHGVLLGLGAAVSAGLTGLAYVRVEG
ncbi:MAG: hypothetical protein HY303_02210 [Candidatus Wallbacteria bacterium]|nr:hypothetical protein [Candidatus Wallbacteria bacterium]